MKYLLLRLPVLFCITDFCLAQKMSDEAGEEKPKKATFLKKAERAACWEAKDNLWACWDKGYLSINKKKLNEFFLVKHLLL